MMMSPSANVMMSAGSIGARGGAVRARTAGCPSDVTESERRRLWPVGDGVGSLGGTTVVDADVATFTTYSSRLAKARIASLYVLYAIRWKMILLPLNAHSSAVGTTSFSEAPASLV